VFAPHWKSGPYIPSRFLHGILYYRLYELLANFDSFFRDRPLQTASIPDRSIAHRRSFKSGCGFIPGGPPMLTWHARRAADMFQKAPIGGEGAPTQHFPASVFKPQLPTSRSGAHQKHHRKCSVASSKLCISALIANMAARPLHGLQSVEQFADFQRSMRLSRTPTGEAHHDAAERTSAHLLTNQVSCKNSSTLSST
jgi:hypothetical protein